MPESINMLTNVKVAELSIVRRGANGKRIALTKGDNMEFNEVLKNVLETPAEGEEKLIDTLKSQGLDEEAQTAAIAQFRAVAGFKDQLSGDAFNAVAQAAGYEMAKAKKEEDKEEEDLEDDKLPFQGKKKKKEEEDMKKSVTLESLQKNFDEQNTQLEALRKSNDDKDTQIAEIQKSAKRKELIVECEKSFPYVPGMTYATMADTLLSCTNEVAKTLRKSWKETSEAVSKSDLLKSAGRQGTADGSASAEIKLENLVKEKVAKSELSQAQAYKAVMAENPGLYEEYLDQNPSQK